MYAELRLPNSEKEIKIKELISKNDEKFLELNFFEDDDFKFEMKVNKQQLDYYYDFMDSFFDNENDIDNKDYIGD